MDDVPDSLDATALAARLGVSTRTLRSWVRARAVPRPPAHGHLTRFDRRAIVIAHAVAALRRNRIPLPQIVRYLAGKTELELRELGGLPAPKPARPIAALPADGSPSSNVGRPQSALSGSVVPGALTTREEPSGSGVPIGAQWRRIELLPGLELHLRDDASAFVHGIAAAIASGRFGDR